MYTFQTHHFKLMLSGIVVVNDESFMLEVLCSWLGVPRILKVVYQLSAAEHHVFQSGKLTW